MADEYLHNLTDTWNNGGTTFDGIKLNVSSSASAADSTLFNFQINGEVKGKLVKDGSLLIRNNDAGAAAGPIFTLHRDSASPADSDILGQIDFAGEDDGSNQTTYGRIYAQAKDVTDTTEDGKFVFQTMVGGSLTTVFDTGPSTSWTPVPTFASGAASNVTVNGARYCRIGPVIFFSCDVSFRVGTGSGVFTVAGLPEVALSNDAVTISYLDRVDTVSDTHIYAEVDAGTSAISFYTQLVDGGNNTMAAATAATHFNASGSDMRLIVSGSYFVA